jgi:probable F420-dependent oxidoreductase
MKVGLNVTGLEVFYGGDLTGVFDVISRADEKGVDIVYCSDHLGFSGAAHAARRASHGFPFELEQPWYEPTLFLSAAAFQTRRIRLSTFVLVAPLRPALLLAKQLATLDVLSGGRVTVALGVGWQADEYRAAGMCFEGRLGDLEDQVEAMRALWGAAPASGRGRRFSFEDFHSYPLPVQGQGLPMLFGLGPSTKNLDRIARLAQGWAMAPSDRPLLRAKARELASLSERHGRDPSDLEIHVGQSAVQAVDGSLDRGAVRSAAKAAIDDGATTLGFLATGFCRSAREVDEFLDFIVDLKG